MDSRDEIFNSYLLKATLSIQDGRPDDGIDEMRKAIYESAKLPTDSGRKNIERILTLAHEYDVFEEVEDILEEGGMREKYFGG
ncbi:MAG TPA: hypothetical protein VGB30_01205 [bacterium]|jgi:vacuolar-type H+-ATPase subunit H